MSGTMQYRVNRSWFDATQVDVGFHRLWADFLAFFDAHPEFEIDSYGTGKVEAESGLAAWVAWANGDGSGAPPFGDNSWFVATAQKASATLNGDGSRQYQAKFQFTSATAFDDCNVADVEHGSGTEGTTHIMFVRFSPDGGWVGPGTLDFVAVTASDNMIVADHALSDINYYLHIRGDDDTVVWEGQLEDKVTPLPSYIRQRGGMLGETVRRNANHDKPELAIVAPMTDGNGYDLKRGWNEAATAIFNAPQQGSTVPTFSLAADDSEVTQHRFLAGHDGMGANADLLFNGGPDPWTGDDEFLGIDVRQDHQEHNSILGQLRLWQAAGNHVSEGSLYGDGTRLSVGRDTATRGGIASPWPGATTSPIF
jgi:hypothetical protein